MNQCIEQYKNYEVVIDNTLTLIDIDSQYYDIEDMQKVTNFKSKRTTYEYTSIHLNIQRLPAIFEKLKLLLYELQDQKIDLDFILTCETFLTDNIPHLYNIFGYNLKYKNRHDSARGGL